MFLSPDLSDIEINMGVVLQKKEKADTDWKYCVAADAAAPINNLLNCFFSDIRQVR